jgi:hypothetical protein
MKKTLYAIACITMLFGFSATAFAQKNITETTTHSTPKWISKMGFWIIESNINRPKHNIVYFYNNHNILVYKETTDGFVLDLDRRRTKMRLKKLVDQTVMAYAQKQSAAENEMLVANQIK